MASEEEEVFCCCSSASVAAVGPGLNLRNAAAVAAAANRVASSASQKELQLCKALQSALQRQGGVMRYLYHTLLIVGTFWTGHCLEALCPTVFGQVLPCTLFALMAPLAL